MRKSYIEKGEVYFWIATINGWQRLLQNDGYKDIIIVLFTMLACTLVNVAAAQVEKPEMNLTKTEKIWVAAYDDTTKALAWLFIKKRNNYTKNQKTMYFVLGASTAAMIGGGLWLENDLNSSPTASFNQTNYAGLLLMLAGTAGVLGSSVSLASSYIGLNPYTLKKYNRLIDLQKANKTLPEFYLKRMEMTPVHSNASAPSVKPVNKTTTHEKYPWSFELAIRYAMDAEGFHFAPAVGIGFRKQVAEFWSLNTGYTFFQSPFTGSTDYTFNIHTLDALAIYHFSPSQKKGFFAGGGLAFQLRNDEYYNFSKKKDLTLAYNFGYNFQVTLFERKRNFAFDVKAFGPIFYDNTTEILTQLMAGFRFRFHDD